MGTTGLGMEEVEVVMRIRFEREDTLWLFMIMILVYFPVILCSIGHFFLSLDANSQLKWLTYIPSHSHVSL